MNFRVSLCICTERSDSDRDCVDSVGHFETGYSKSFSFHKSSGRQVLLFPPLYR